MAMIAISSANVATTFCSSVGKSLVYRRYRIGPSTLHQLLAYADDVNLLGDNIDTIHKNTNPN
jgi:hypothetical protein